MTAGSSAGFRPEVQALRALAVAMVVVFHLWPGSLTGGYVGVDVFFVISGFLITGHLASEVGRSGRISLVRFWARRIRRLLPAASVVLVASFGIMLAVVPKSLWQQTVTEIGSSALYVQNWALGGNSVDYLAADNTPTLVQHFWSLSVEEQFYIAWPLAILAAIAIARGRNSRRALAIALGAIFVVSIVYSVFETARSQPSAYFNTGTRAWEFAAGGLLALARFQVPARLRLALPHVRAAASWAGLALIGFAAFTFDGKTAFPGMAAIAPVAGAVLVIFAGSNGARWSATRSAGLRPLQVVGDHSYSIYLWHWPLVVAVPYAIGSELNWPGKLAIIAASLALAWLTKRFVEDPLRVRRAARPRARRAYLLAGASALMILVATVSTWQVVQAGSAAAARSAIVGYESDSCYGAGSMVQPDCPSPFAVTATIDTAFAAVDKGSLGQPCSSVGVWVNDSCVFGQTEHPLHTVAIIGNSHAGHLVAGLEAYATAHDWEVVLMRKTDCLGVSTESFGPRSNRDCIQWTKNLYSEFGARTDIDVVMFASHEDAIHYLEPGGLDSEQENALQEHISANFAALVAAGKSVVVVGDVPGTRPVHAPDCVYQHRAEYDPCATRRDAGLEDDNVESRAARETPGVGYLSLLPYLCDRTTCHDVIGGAVVYLDDHHLTASFSRSLAPYLGAAIQTQLASRLAGVP